MKDKNQTQPKGITKRPCKDQIFLQSIDNSYYRLKYEQISKRRGKKRAIIAVARMILTAVFQMLSTGSKNCRLLSRLHVQLAPMQV